MSRQDKHKIATTLRVATHKSKLLLSRKFLILIPTTATLGILALVSVMFTSADTASNTYAANLGSQITTEVDGQYYVTLTAPDVNFSVSPSKNENAAKQRIDVNVETNVAGGAKLYLSMAGSSNSLHLNGNIAQASPVIAAVPDGTDASSFPANTWGYSTDDQTYSAVPTTASDPASLANIDGETTGTTSGSVISASIPVYYAANVDTSIQPGSYSNRMTYSAVVDGGITTSATLTKIEVSGAEVENMQAEVENTLQITTNFMANTYGEPRVYYETTSPVGYAECGDVVVGRDESGYMVITCKVTPSQIATGVTLHVVPKGSSDDRFCTDGTYTPNTSNCEAGSWKWGSFVVEAGDIAAPPRPLTDLTYMQEMTPGGCEKTTVGDTKQLIDQRDSKNYWVTKLSDGNCWMTQNLDLNLSTSTTLTPANTNVSSNWTPPVSTRTNNTSSSYWRSDTGQSYDPGNEYYEGTGNAHYHAGNYYQYSVASAGCSSKSGNECQTSICPAGWTLPSNAQFESLENVGLTRYNFYRSPYYFLRSGYLNSTYGLDDTSTHGFYWSSTTTGSSSYWFYVHANGIYYDPISNAHGISIRCIVANN